jgi:hypothetical protein
MVGSGTGAALGCRPCASRETRSEGMQEGGGVRRQGQSTADQDRLRGNPNPAHQRPEWRVPWIPAPFRFASGIFDLRGNDNHFSAVAVVQVADARSEAAVCKGPRAALGCRLSTRRDPRSEGVQEGGDVRRRGQSTANQDRLQGNADAAQLTRHATAGSDQRALVSNGTLCQQPMTSVGLRPETQVPPLVSPRCSAGIREPGIAEGARGAPPGAGVRSCAAGERQLCLPSRARADGP